jgi:hypothetical protein
VVGDLLLRARHGRALGLLPPACPGRDGTGAVAGHHHRVVPAGPGPGQGDRASPYVARRCWHRSAHRTMGLEDQQYRGPLAGPPRTRQGRPRTRPHSRRFWPGPVLPQRPGRLRRRITTPGQPQPLHSGPASARRVWSPAGLQQREASNQTCPAQRGNQGLQPGSERPSSPTVE